MISTKNLIKVQNDENKTIGMFNIDNLIAFQANEHSVDLICGLSGLSLKGINEQDFKDTLNNALKEDCFLFHYECKTFEDAFINIKDQDGNSIWLCKFYIESIELNVNDLAKIQIDNGTSFHTSLSIDEVIELL